MRARLCLPLLLCLAVQGGPSAADDQSLVRLDIHATRDGAPVLDLAASDLELSEGGTPQAIELLRHVSSPSRSFVVFLDTLHLRFEGARDVRIPLGTFLDRLLDDDDAVGVMTPETSPRDLAFTTKADVISRAMQDEAMWDRARIGARDRKEDLYAQCFPANQYRDLARDMQDRHREQATLDALERLVSLLASREERTAVIVVTDGWALFGPSSRLGSAQAGGRSTGGFGGAGRGGFPGIGGRGGGGGRRVGGDPDEDSPSVDSASRAECDTDRLALAAANNGIRLDRLADAANRAMTSFYTIYARGLAPERGRVGTPAVAVDQAESDPAARIDSMRQLSVNTDAVSVTTRAGLESASTRVAADMSAYDVLTYHSTNTKLDGRFRAVVVRTLRPGVVVRTRRGYRGATADDLLSGREGTASTVESAFGTLPSTSPRSAFRIRTATARTSGRTGATLWVVGELDYRAKRELAWTTGAVADVVVVAGDGREIVSQTLDVPGAETFRFQLPDSVGLEPGEYAVRVRLRPNNDGGLPVSDTARVVVPSSEPTLGEGLLWRRGPSTGPRFMLTADARFLRSDRIRVELPTRSASQATARMVNRLGAPNQIPVQVSERMDPANGLRWIIAEAALAALAPGDYAIETTLAGATQLTPFQLVP